MARWRLLILVTTLIGGAVAFAASGILKPIHKATASLLVGDATKAPNVTKEDIDASRILASTYATLVRGRSVLSSVVRDSGLDYPWEELRDRVFTEVDVLESPVITITTYADAPDEAERIAGDIIDSMLTMIPAGTADPLPERIPAFALTQAQDLQERIRKADARAANLEDELASARSAEDTARILAEIQVEAERVIELQARSTVPLQYISLAGAPNTLRVLESAEASPGTLGPELKTNVVLGAAIGACGGFLALSWASARRVRRRRGDRTDKASVDSWLQELSEAN
jgi:capsular polysaccharide biosynthesis protein